jgi:hypothetical protein
MPEKSARGTCRQTSASILGEIGNESFYKIKTKGTRGQEIPRNNKKRFFGCDKYLIKSKFLQMEFNRYYYGD